MTSRSESNGSELAAPWPESAAHLSVAILNAIPSPVALIGVDGIIFATNDDWARLSTQQLPAGCATLIGKHFQTAGEQVTAEFAATAGAVARGLAAVLQGTAPEFSLEYPGRNGGRSERYQLVITPLKESRGMGAMVTLTKVTGPSLAEEPYRAIFEQVEEGLFRCTPDGKFLMVNPACARLHGYDSAEEMLRGSAGLTRGEGPPSPDILEFLRRLWEKGSVAGFECQTCRRDGRRFWVAIGARAGFAADGIPGYFDGSIQDITDRRRTRQALLASEGRYEDLVEIAHDLVWTVDPDGTIIFVNQSCRRILGYEPEEMVGRSFVDFLPPGEVERAEAAFAAALLTNNAELSYLTCISRKDGRVVTVSANSRVMRDPTGRVIGATSNARDMTESLRAQAVLRESEARFRSLFEEAAVGMCLLGADGSFLRVNDRLGEILGYPTAGLLALSCLAVTHPDDRAQTETGIREIWAGQRTTFGIENRFLRQDGVAIWCKVKLSLLPGTGDTPAGFVGVIDEITGRKLAEREALRATETLAGVVKAQQELNDSAGSTGDVMMSMVGWAQRLTEAAGALIEVVEGQDLVCEAAAGEAAAIIGRRSPLAGGFAGEAVRSRAVIYCESVPQDPRTDVAVARDLAAQSLIAAPLRVDDQIIGVLQVFSRQPRAFSPRDLNNLRILVETLGGVLHRRRAAGVLEASVAEFRNLAEAMPQIVWVTQPDGRSTYFNQVWLNYTGFTLPGSLDEGWLGLIHPADQPRTREAWQTAIRTAGAYSQEARIRRADGEYRWWLIRGVPQRDAEGRVRSWFGTCTDIHDFKLADLEIRNANRALKMLSGCNEALIHATDEFELLRQVCQLAVETGGYRMAWVGYAMADEAHSIQPMAHAGPATEYLAQVNLNWKEGHPLGQGPAARCIRSGRVTVCADMAEDNGFAPWQLIAARHGFRSLICLPLRDGQHTFGLLTLYSGDVDQTGAAELKLWEELADDLAFGINHLRRELERRKANEQLEEQAALLNAASDAIILKDMADNILFWNHGAERVYGWTAEEARGKKSRELFLPDPVQFEAGLEVLRKQGQWQGELQKLTRQGQYVPVEVRWTLVRDDHGEAKSILAINTDITLRKKMETQFLRVQRLECIGTLASGIAHDLNNVLTPILVGTKLLEDKVSGGELELLMAMASSAQRGAELIKQVLTFARGAEGRRIPVNLKQVVRDVQDIIRNTFPKGLKFSCFLEEKLWPVSGDPTQLLQVIMNLCVNSRDAMPTGGQLDLRLSNRELDEVFVSQHPGAIAGPYVLLEVADNGPGIPEAIQDQVFEPFFTTKDSGHGTGLGLSTVLNIVKGHQGIVELVSRLRAGTLFKIYLPALAPDTAVAPLVVPAGVLPGGHGELVLVVDDDDAVRQVVQKTLQNAGYSVLLAANGAEALSLYVRHAQEIALVLTDMAMPIMDGPSTIAALRAIHPQIKIIGSSGHASKGGDSKAFRAGADHFLPKPYLAETLLRLVAEVIAE